MARSFTVGGQALSAANTASVNSNTAITVSVWAKITNGPGVGAFRFMFGQNGGPDWGINHAAATNIISYGWSETGTVADTGLWTAGVWSHWAIAFNGVDTLYINGSTVASNNPGFVGAQTVDFTIGGFAGNVFGGQLADYAFWDGVTLTAGELKALTAGARPWTIRPGKLKVYCPIDGLQSPEPDLSGNANNFTLSSAPAFAAGPPVMMFTPRWPQHLPTPIPAFLISIGVGSYALNAGWPSAGLLHRWPLDSADNAGGVNADLVSGDNATEAGTVTSATGPTGAANAARSFDGLTGYAAFASSPIPTSGAYSISLWAMTPNVSAGSTTATAQTLLNLGTSTGNQIRLVEDNGTVGGPTGGLAWATQVANAQNAETSTAVFANNTWVQVGLTFDGAATYTTYVNGAVVSTPGTGPNNPTANDTLGAKTSTSSFFDGSIAQLMIFNRALSASEVAELYNYPTGIGETLTLVKKSKTIAQAGSYSLTGENATIKRTVLTKAATAVYALNGQNVILAVAHKAGIGVGLYSFTGETVHTYFGHTVTPQAGTYLVVGNNETLTATRRILLQSGFVQVAGESVKLVAAFPPPPFVPPSPPKLLGLEAISNLFGSM